MKITKDVITEAQNMNYIPCSFINTEGGPEKISDWEGFFVKERGRELELYGTRTYFYKHPEAPDEAFITVSITKMIKKVKEGDRGYAALFIFLQTQKIVINDLDVVD